MERLSPEIFFSALERKARSRRVPEGALFELTYGCNLRCVHCYNPTHKALPRELTTAEVFDILDQCAEFGVASIAFSGGELFVRPDVFRIFGHARRLGFILDLISNATRITPESAARLREIGFRNLAISIYGATKGTYERVTQIPGSYDTFLRGIECLVEKKLPLTLRMPVLADNAHEVREARDLVEGMGVKFQYCLDVTPRTDGDLSPLKHRLSPAEKVRVDLDMVGYQDPSDAASCGSNDGFISCSCGRSRFAITPYGEMNLCAIFPMPRYDLRKGTIREGWEVLKKTVDEAKPNHRYECPSCLVRPHCRQGRNDAWLETGDMSVCLPHYKEFAFLQREVGASKSMSPEDKTPFTKPEMISIKPTETGPG